MKKVGVLVSFLLLIGLLAACSNNDNENLEEELAMLEVNFDVPETAEPGETISLKAHVTYDGEPEENAEVLFEIWKTGHEDDSEKLEGENKGNGDYTLDYTFEEEAVYEMYAHTDGQGQHTMPKEEITVGDAESADNETSESDSDESSFHTEGFDMNFTEPEDVTKDKATLLSTYITQEEDAFEDLDVRYEIVEEGNEESTEWVDASEDAAGEYTADYTFPNEGTYVVTIHVENDDELHEHTEHEITVE